VQIFEWIKKGAHDFSGMTDIPLGMRQELATRFSLFDSTVQTQRSDSTGTTKIGFKLRDGAIIESVLLIDQKGRSTACLSSQVGCPLGCTFCKTGSMGFVRNLKSAEIIEQFVQLHAGRESIDNVVFMGMGEAFLNSDALFESLDILCTDWHISPRRITVSTAGVAAGIAMLSAQKYDIRLAFSLTTADSQLRERLMPITKTNPLPLIKEALCNYQTHHKQRITLELVLLKNVNTRPDDIQALISFAHGLNVVVNIIPWNTVEGISLQKPTNSEIHSFAQALEHAGLNVTRRFGRGSSLSAACGQLGYRQ
jgi:23S rRNA (adenine2503-C2)-methyltransferase